MLLAGEPLDRARDLRGPAFGEPSVGMQPVEEGDAREPPERGVDAAEIPEVGLGAAGVDELRDLAVRRLMRRERREAGRGGAFQGRIAGDRHAERAHRGVAAEDGAVAASVRAGRRRRREYPVGSEVAREEPHRFRAAAVDQLLVWRRGGIHRADYAALAWISVE